MSGTLHYLLVIADPDAVTPYDPSSTALPGDEHYWISSQRRGSHPWIAQQGDGPDAGPDINIGGQRLEMPLGQTVDAECQVRVIDEAAPIAGVACDVNASLIDEGDVGLDSDAITSGDWVVDGDYTGTYGPRYSWSHLAGPYNSFFALFNWGTPFDGGPWVRSSWITRTLDGTESGGSAFTPGQLVGFRFRVNWTLQTGGGNVFAEANGIRLTGISPGFDFWDVPVDPLNQQVDSVIYCLADGAGEVVVKLGLENYYPSCNVFVMFTDLQAVECDTAIVSVDAERYTTSSLADDDARQKLLGRPYYLKASSDGGTTFDEMLYAGYLKQATMERSLTFLLTGGDAGRGRRNSKAWSGLSPVEDFVP
jgi:hypothetical protein